MGGAADVDRFSPILVGPFMDKNSKIKSEAGETSQSSTSSQVGHPKGGPTQSTAEIQSLPLPSGVSQQCGTRHVHISPEDSLEGPSNTHLSPMALPRKALDNPRSSPTHTDQDQDIDALALNMMRVRVKKKGPCGAEKKRRRMARIRREAAEIISAASIPNPLPSSLKAVVSKNGSGQILSTGITSIHNVDETMAGPSRLSADPQQATLIPKHDAVSSTKYMRTPGSMLTEETSGLKHPRAAPMMEAAQGQIQYAQVASEDRSLSLVVMRQSQRQLAFSQNDRTDFIDAVGEVISQLPEDHFPPQFGSTRIWRGYLLVTAVNAASREWLRRNLNQIRPWEDILLEAVDYDEFCRLQRVVIIVPSRGRLSDEIVLRNLIRQNPGLSASSWKVWERREEGRNLRLVIGMDEGSVSFIRRMCGLLFYNSGRVHVRIPTTRARPAPADASSRDNGSWRGE